MDPRHLTKELAEKEKDYHQVRQTFVEHKVVLRAAYERITAVHRS